MVGVVGKPNAGKSTFFKALTMADAEIANFPFTTIKPNIGVGYVRSECACGFFKLSCSPKNSYCQGSNRFTPVKLIDVAGLVPGAHEGKGLGNQFLDDLRQADVLIHVVDVSGRTNERGEPSEGCDPENDIRFLSEEIDLWFAGIIQKNWEKIRTRVQYENKDLIKELAVQLSGLQVNEGHIKRALDEAGVDEAAKFTGDAIERFARTLRAISKPIMIAANKIDVDTSKNYERLKGKYEITPVCAEAELALREAGKKGLIGYTPGDPKFDVKAGLEPKQQKALDFIKAKILDVYGSTGVQQCLNAAVFGVLKQIVVYPVENESKISDSKGNVLPDSYLINEGSTAVELAYKVHTDIGSKFISAIDCKTKMRVGRDHRLKDGDVLKIMAGR
ncbi:MAG: redox-regulated ATPase YchF [Candidatus Altiarchaeota archaeon]|nr:redox-regulated ATPase YchF [Candidatus Altiarchaeota archaeon]